MEPKGNISVWVTILFIGSLHLPVIISGLPAERESLGEQPNKDDNVHIKLVRVKRDIGNEGSENHRGYQMKITAFDSDYKANLVKTSESIFSSDFKFQVVNDKNEGIRDETPSLDEIKEIEDGHFVDPALGAAVSVSNFQGGVIQRIRGIIGDITITPNRENNHVATKRNSVEKNDMDYIDLKRNVTQGISTRAAAIAQPEVFVIFDNANYKTFNGNTKDIIDYLAVFFHGVNNRFATISDPKINFKISGIRAIDSSAGEPFMENNKTPDGKGYDINQVLESYSKWIYTNRNTIPKHDLAIVISGRDFQSKDSTGKYTNNVAGLAYLNSACWVEPARSKSFATSVGEDIGGYYDGVFTVAHELAHNLGAPHDGPPGACSWDDGYLMSYAGWGTKNKFFFSSCSINLMKTFIQSSGANCLKSIQNANDVAISNDNPGDRLDMTALCRKYSKQPSAVVDSSKNPSDLCKNLVCKYPTPGRPTGWTSILTLNHPPGDNSRCGSGGRCINGDCVTSTG